MQETNLEVMEQHSHVPSSTLEEYKKRRRRRRRSLLVKTRQLAPSKQEFIEENQLVLDCMNSQLLVLLLQQLCFVEKPPKKNDLRTSLPINKGGRLQKET